MCVFGCAHALSFTSPKPVYKKHNSELKQNCLLQKDFRFVSGILI